MEIEVLAPEKFISTSSCEEPNSYEEPITEEFNYQEVQLSNDIAEADVIDTVKVRLQSNSDETQTDLTMGDIEGLFTHLEKRKTKLAKKQCQLDEGSQKIAKSRMSLAFFENDDTKTQYFTGLSDFSTLLTIYKAIENNIPDCFMRGLNKFQVLMLTLIKLRLDLPFSLLGHMFGISTQTASKKFYDCMPALSSELGAFISWPVMDLREYYTPEPFVRVFGKRLTVIVDFYEIRIQKAASVATADINSQHKSTDTETVKYLICIAPNGAIIYTSKGYTGKNNDKFIAENSDFLNFVQAGDIVLSNRGSIIQEAVPAKCSDLDVSEFLKTKVQLDNFAVEDSKHLRDLRVLVKQMIDTLRAKYLILINTQSPFVCIKRKPKYVDTIVRTCCALANCSPSVLPPTLFEAKV